MATILDLLQHWKLKNGWPGPYEEVYGGFRKTSQYICNDLIARVIAAATGYLNHDKHDCGVGH